MPGWIEALLRLALYCLVFGTGLYVGLEWNDAATQKERADTVTKNFEEYKKQAIKDQNRNLEVLKSYETKMFDLDMRYRSAGRLRLPASVCEPAKGGSPGPTQADAGTVALPESIEANLLGLTRQADEIVEQCRALQDWVKKAE
jgi:hypothetical protein